MVLTGGASRRMGRTKATLPAGSTTLARRTAALLAQVAGFAVEVGPGYSGLPCAADTLPGSGPLAALTTGAAWLNAAGWDGPALVVATDLPRLTAPLLAWLAAYRVSGSVVPLDAGGRPQPLCARYCAADLAVAMRLVSSGRRRMSDLLEALTDVAYVDAGAWGPVAGPDALIDVDTPSDLAAFGGMAPGTGGVGRGPKARR